MATYGNNMNYNRPKVKFAFVKLGYMLENLVNLELPSYNKVKVITNLYNYDW